MALGTNFFKLELQIADIVQGKTCSNDSGVLFSICISMVLGITEYCIVKGSKNYCSNFHVVDEQKSTLDDAFELHWFL